MKTKRSLQDYTRDEFVGFVSNIVGNKAKDELEGDEWLEHFIAIVPHPEKSDLIYWPKEGADDSPVGIVGEIEQYCQNNGLPGFKDSNF